MKKSILPNISNTLILNPTENIPMHLDSEELAYLEGLYVSTESRNENSKVIFGGREAYSDIIRERQKDWCKVLGAAAVDLRTLSGLHAHIIAFMSLGNIGDKVLLLPEEAGGHFSTKNILERLGFEVISPIIDYHNLCIDLEKTKILLQKEQPDFIFIDRSEGLYYEDFSRLTNETEAYCIFDASQYLTQIICNIYMNPFEMGFHMIISTLHKNFPGPQKAIIATVHEDEQWAKLIQGSNTFVSNSHPKSLMQAVLSLNNNIDLLNEYANDMILLSNKLEEYLHKNKVPVILKNDSMQRTQHIWIHTEDKEKIYQCFRNLEKIGIMVNYRLLPYNLGYGLRLGTGGAIQMGLREKHIPILSEIIANVYYNNEHMSDLKKKFMRLLDDIRTSKSQFFKV